MIKGKRKQESSRNLSHAIIKGMEEKKAIDITILDLRPFQNAIADFFIICSGNSDTQVEAIMDGIEAEVYKAFIQYPWKTEGTGSKEWILVDYVDVVAHVFLKEKRQRYGLEELWGDAIVESID